MTMAFFDKPKNCNIKIFGATNINTNLGQLWKNFLEISIALPENKMLHSKLNGVRGEKWCQKCTNRHASIKDLEREKDAKAAVRSIQKEEKKEGKS